MGRASPWDPRPGPGLGQIRPETPVQHPNTRTDGSAPSPGTWGDFPATQDPGSRHRPGLPQTEVAQGRPEPASAPNLQDPTAIPEGPVPKRRQNRRYRGVLMPRQPRRHTIAQENTAQEHEHTDCGTPAPYPLGVSERALGRFRGGPAPGSSPAWRIIPVGV